MRRTTTTTTSACALASLVLVGLAVGQAPLGLGQAATATPYRGPASRMMMVEEAQRAVPARGGYLFKRSLCNTFGGCGAKRSFGAAMLATLDRAGEPARDPENSSRDYQAANQLGGELLDGETAASLAASNPNSSLNSKSYRAHLRAQLIAEILDNLLEHLQLDQRYNKGKYVLVVPKHHEHAQDQQEVGGGLGVLRDASQSGQPQPRQQQPAAGQPMFAGLPELQEIPLGVGGAN